MGWMLFPFFSDPRIKWAMGNGVRSTITLDGFYDKVLNNLLAFKIGNVTIPTGLFLVFGLGCLAFWVFQKSKTGVMMKVSGMNPMFGRSIGIDNDRMRGNGNHIIHNLRSHWNSRLRAGDWNVSAVYSTSKHGISCNCALSWLGGALEKANIWHVIIGVVLYQAILTIAPVVSAQLIDEGSPSEIARVIICNGLSFTH